MTTILTVILSILGMAMFFAVSLGYVEATLNSIYALLWVLAVQAICILGRE